MGKVCVSHDTLLITDDDSTTQDDKSLPPCMQLQAGVGFNFLPSDTNPPPRLQLRDGVGFYYPFFRVNERQPASVCTTTTTTASHVGSSLSSASICTHDNPTTHPLACNCETGWVFIILFFESTNANLPPSARRRRRAM